MQFRRHYSTLFVSSVVTVAAFVTASAYSQHRLARLDTLSASIEANAVPSIEELARAHAELSRLEDLVDGLDTTEDPSAAVSECRASLAAMQGDVRAYLALPPLPGEQKFWATLRTDVGTAVTAANAVLDAASRHDRAQVARVRLMTADPAFDRAERAILQTLEFDAATSGQLAREVRAIRTSTRDSAFALDALAAILAVLAASIAYRASRQHDALLDAHALLLSDRVAELDRFAGRVAHDIRGPLGAIAVGLQLLVKSDESRRADHAARAERALQRVQQLVDALLLFARSGARPEPGATCSVDAVLASLAADCADLARSDSTELVIEPHEPLTVACSAGVATSILENLVRNAIKYMGNSTVRRVTIRVARHGAEARIEVEDTGPGIVPALQQRIFDPFVRGDDGSDGVGLGLATVKRLVERHGGTIGIHSVPDHGSTFVVELPLARAVTHAVEPAV